MLTISILTLKEFYNITKLFYPQLSHYQVKDSEMLANHIDSQLFYNYKQICYKIQTKLKIIV